jgi:hypothetical protein
VVASEAGDLDGGRRMGDELFGGVAVFAVAGPSASDRYKENTHRGSN